MALPLVFLDTFGHYPLGATGTSSKWTSGSVASFAGDEANSPASLIRSLGAGGQSAAIGVRFRATEIVTADREIFALLESGVAVARLMRRGTDGALQLITSAGTITSTKVVQLEQDFHLELAVRFQGASSTFEVRRQGVQVADLTGTDTITAAVIDGIRLDASGCVYGYAWARSGTGAVVAGDFMGPLAPSVALIAFPGFFVGANWSGSVGDVDEQHMDLDSSYRATTTAPSGAAADRWSARLIQVPIPSGLGVLPADAVYRAIQVCVAARRENASAATYRITLNSASTTSNGASITAPAGTYGYGLRVLETDPIEGGAWTEKKIGSNKEYGVEALTLA